MCYAIQKTKQEKPFPCGRCGECRAKRVSAWSFRLMQEDKRSISSHFITLTYDTKHIPISPRGYMQLSIRDLQLFFKKLRKAHGKDAKAIKYYAVGEYGGKTWRPHYHIILFNCRVELIEAAWSVIGIDKNACKTRFNIGNVHYGKVSGASVGYTLKYISKPSKIPQHANDDRKKEFSLISKGIGSNYLNGRLIQWHKSDLENRYYVNLNDGKKAAMPRYYKDKLYSQEEKERIVHHQNSERATRIIHDKYSFDVERAHKKREYVKHQISKQLNNRDAKTTI